ncbi:MAG: hypothetical protein AAF629_06250 [Chloroflexota bacterium]
MDTQLLKRQFAKMGAQLDVQFVSAQPRSRSPWARMVRDFSLDIAERGPKGRDEVFTLTVREELQDQLDFMAVDVRPKDRHLLLMLKRLESRVDRTKEKFLCGHDERHWFVASVPDVRGIANVTQAMEALKPDMVVGSQKRAGVKVKDWHKRKNAGYIRQGEWFFLPEPSFKPQSPWLILYKEPISRGGGKPHFVEQVYRVGGETVYVSHRNPNGLTEPEYRELIKRRPKLQKLNWRVMRRNPTVYAKGKVRHPDHQTIILPFWHRVAMNIEHQSVNVAFLD